MKLQNLELSDQSKDVDLNLVDCFYHLHKNMDRIPEIQSNNLFEKLEEN